MARILISWVAKNNDFLNTRPKDVNPDGPNALVHKHFFEYDHHVLLTTAKDPMDDVDFQKLVLYLKRTYGHDIIQHGLDLRNSDIINIIDISQKISDLLRIYRHDEIEIFVSPGTATMQTAWYLAHLNLGLNTRLFQTLSPAISKASIPKRIDIAIDNENYIHALYIREALNKTEVKGKAHIIGPLTESYSLAKRVSPANVSVLISGGTGTGKELLAEYIHANSQRKGKFVAINCGAFTTDLLESRLFGYEAGAFTGAIKSRTGFFHEANHGTIFLDEIGDISPYMQQILLRVLSKKEILRVGSNKPEPIDVRVIAASHKDTYEMSMKNEFRDDLFYRLATVEISLPSISEYSPSEKEELFSFLWSKAKREFKNWKEPLLPPATRKILLTYPYHGNIREMENIIYGIWAEYDSKSNKIRLPRRVLSPPQKHSLKLIDIEFNHIRKVYMSCKENVAQAAKILDISPTTLRTKLRLHEQ